MGVATQLDPEFDAFQVATPYARAFLGLDGSGVEQLARDLLGELLTTGTALLKLPQRVEQTWLGWNRESSRSKWIRNSEDRSAGSGAGLEATPVAVLQCLALPGPLCSRQHWHGGILFLTAGHQLLAAWFCLLLAALCALRGWVRG